MAGGRLTDWISLGVLASWVPADAIDDAIEATGKSERRGGRDLRRGDVGCLGILCSCGNVCHQCRTHWTSPRKLRVPLCVNAWVARGF